MPPLKFEKRIVEWIGGTPNTKQTGDGGIDGRIMASKTGISVKRQDKAGRNVVDNLKSALEREKLVKGIIIAFDFTKDAYAEVSRLKAANEADITLTKVKDIVPINEPPIIKLVLDGKNIKANATDPDGEIVNYAWSVDGEIVKLVDTTSLLEIENEWKKGKHTIACKATDSGAASTKTFYSLEEGVLAPLYRDEKQ